MPIANMLVVNDIHRTRHEAHDMELRMVSTNDRLPTLSVLRLSNPEAPPQRGLPFYLLLVLVLVLVPLLCHMLRRSLLCRVAHVHKIWLQGCGRIDKHSM